MNNPLESVLNRRRSGIVKAIRRARSLYLVLSDSRFEPDEHLLEELDIWDTGEDQLAERQREEHCINLCKCFLQSAQLGDGHIVFEHAANSAPLRLGQRTLKDGSVHPRPQMRESLETVMAIFIHENRPQGAITTDSVTRILDTCGFFTDSTVARGRHSFNYNLEEVVAVFLFLYTCLRMASDSLALLTAFCDYLGDEGLRLPVREAVQVMEQSVWDDVEDLDFIGALGLRLETLNGELTDELDRLKDSAIRQWKAACKEIERTNEDVDPNKDADTNVHEQTEAYSDDQEQEQSGQPDATRRNDTSSTSSTVPARRPRSTRNIVSCRGE